MFVFSRRYLFCLLPVFPTAAYLFVFFPTASIFVYFFPTTLPQNKSSHPTLSPICKSASHAVLRRMQLTLRATRRTPHGASRLVQAMSAWSVKTARAPSRHCRDARIYGHTTTAVHDEIITPSPCIDYFHFSRANSETFLRENVPHSDCRNKHCLTLCLPARLRACSRCSPFFPCVHAVLACLPACLLC
ncbi:unnamed protein product, partial [Laminaria digitata]